MAPPSRRRNRSLRAVFSASWIVPGKRLSKKFALFGGFLQVHPMIFGLTNGRLSLLLNYIQVNNSLGLVWHPLNPPLCRQITRASLPKGLYSYFLLFWLTPDQRTLLMRNSLRNVTECRTTKKIVLTPAARKAGSPNRIKLCWQCRESR